MIYAKFQRDHWNSPAWRLATVYQRGAAISLVAFCAEAENGGVIDGAARWTAGQWRSAVGITRRAVDAAVNAGLCAWEGECLSVLLYDYAGEDAYHRQTNAPPPLAPPPAIPLAPALPPTQPTPQAPPQPDQNPSPNPNPMNPTPSPSSDSPPATAAATAVRIDGVDPGQVRAGLTARDHRALLAAFGCQVAGKESEWDQACDGLSHEGLVAILHQSRQSRDPVRLPSGLRHARSAWTDRPQSERAALGRKACAHYGVLIQAAA